MARKITNPADKKKWGPKRILLAFGLTLGVSTLIFAGWKGISYLAQDVISSADKSFLKSHPNLDPSVQTARQQVLAAIPNNQAAVADTKSSPASATKSLNSLPVRQADLFQPPSPISIDRPSLIVTRNADQHSLEFAFHPSHFADPQRMANNIGLAAIPLDPEPATTNPSVVSNINDIPASASTPYEQACRLERSRRFVRSMCLDQTGRLWIGSEENAPGEGGVQCFDPTKPPLEAFREFTTQNGLGDNNGEALACDTEGRIWVGHRNHGVSVFNGHSWQNYNTFSTATGASVLDGPIGNHVFHISICPITVKTRFHDRDSGRDNPMAGSVWICTNNGISIYFPSTDTWSYLTRAEGLPSDQVNSLAFGSDGTIYIATQCDGIGIGSPLNRAIVWRQIAGMQQLPASPRGSGVPSSLMNDIFVAPTDVVYAASCGGLTWSTDKGASWQYVRGRNWFSKARDSSALTDSQNLTEPILDSDMMPEDYCTCLAADASHLWVGTRQSGFISVDDRSDSMSIGPSNRAGIDPFVTAFVATPTNQLLVGSYGQGIGSSSSSMKFFPNSPDLHIADISHVFPSAATAPSVMELTERLHTIQTAERFQDTAKFIGDDWLTEGDWLGRYGRSWACLFAMANPHCIWGTESSSIDFNARIGTNCDPDDAVRCWVQTLYSTDPRCLEFPPLYLQNRISKGLTTAAVNRRDSSLDDHGETYPINHDGPNLYFSVKIPDGKFVLSLYELNDNGHTGNNRLRDYQIVIRTHTADDLSDISDFDNQPDLARARVQNFYGGVYKKFYLCGPSKITVKLDKNYSVNTILSAVFIDRLQERVQPYSSDADGSLVVAENQPITTFSGVAESLDVLRLRNPIAWILNRELFYVEAARGIVKNGEGISVNSRSIAHDLLASCFFYADDYASWENHMRLEHRIPARDIEKQLKANDLLGSSPDLDLVTEYRFEHP